MVKAKQAEQPERIKTSMELRRDLWAKVRALAVNERRPALAIVEDALDAYLKAAHKGGR
jgi:predicted transcriptional regulator